VADVPVSSDDAIGECIAACVAWNQNATNTVKCVYGLMDSPYGELTANSCSLMSEAYPMPGRSFAGPNNFMVTSDATLVAGAVSNNCSYGNLIATISTTIATTTS